MAITLKTLTIGEADIKNMSLKSNEGIISEMRYISFKDNDGIIKDVWSPYVQDGLFASMDGRDAPVNNNAVNRGNSTLTFPLIRNTAYVTESKGYSVTASTNDYIGIGGENGLGSLNDYVQGDFSIEGYLKIDAPTSGVKHFGIINSNGSGVNARCAIIFILSTLNNPYFRVYDGTAFTDAVVPTKTVDLSKKFGWCITCQRVNETTCNFTFFANGELYTSITNASFPVPNYADNAHRFMFPRGNFGQPYGVSGMLHALRLYNRVITLDEHIQNNKADKYAFGI